MGFWFLGTQMTLKFADFTNFHEYRISLRRSISSLWAEDNPCLLFPKKYNIRKTSFPERGDNLGKSAKSANFSIVRVLKKQHEETPRPKITIAEPTAANGVQPAIGAAFQLVRCTVRLPGPLRVFLLDLAFFVDSVTAHFQKIR